MTWAAGAVLSDWTHAITRRGRRATSPRGDAEIEHVEHLRQPPPLVELVREALAVWPHLELGPLGRVEELITDEGEYASLVSLPAHDGHAALAVTVGAVLCDEAYAVYAAKAPPPGVLETVRHLLRKDVQARGVRRRRFRHTPPAGWSAAQVGYEMHYVPSAGDEALIVVAAASPIPPRTAQTPDELLRQLAGTAAHAPIQATDDLCGYTWLVAGDAGHRRVAFLADRRYLYGVRLDAVAPLDSLTRVFSDLVASIAPLPPPADHGTTTAELGAHWFI